jgi:hypothetical protein
MKSDATDDREEPSALPEFAKPGHSGSLGSENLQRMFAGSKGCGPDLAEASRAKLCAQSIY